MSLIHRLFELNTSSDLTKSVGNMIVSGVNNYGYERLYKDTIVNALSSKKILVLVNGAMSVEDRKITHALVAPYVPESCIYDFGIGTSSQTIDILSAFDNPNDKADFIVKMLTSVTGFPDKLETTALRFFSYVISTLDNLGESYTISDLNGISNEYILEKLDDTTFSSTEKDKRKRFLEDKAMYAAFTEIETSMYQVEALGLLDVWSGSKSLVSALSEGNLLMLSGLINEKTEKKRLLFNTMIYAIEKCLENNKADCKVLFMIRNADFIQPDYIRNALDFNSSYSFSSYLFIEDIGRFITKHGNDFLDKTKSFLVFQQSSNENADFWSGFFGTREMNERSFSYTAKKGLLSYIMPTVGGGVVPTEKNYKTVTQTVSKVDKPIFKATVFKELKDREAMLYLSFPLRRRKVRIED